MKISDISKNKHLYFVGIGGISMSSLAEIFFRAGYPVCGYDRSRTEVTQRLSDMGIKIWYETDESHFENVGLAVATAAIHPDNPEMVVLRRKGIPCITRAELLGALGSRYENSIAVAGTHGKSTTTGMLSEIFIHSEKCDPTVLIGAVLPEIGGTFRVGTDSNFIYEACEYTDSFLSFFPHIAAVLNIQLDHTDYFKDIDAIVSSFSKFINNAGENGFAVVNLDSDNAVAAAYNCVPKKITFSASGKKSADYYAADIKCNGGFAEYDLYRRGELLTHISLSVPGMQNIEDSLCAAVCADLSGIPASETASGLHSFKGVARRFEFKGRLNGAPVFDDYAHHPDEIRATLASAKLMGYSRIVTVFQPHTYSRLHDLFNEFSEAFTDSDLTVFADIFSASRETNIYGISSKDLSDAVPGSLYLPSFAEIEDYLRKEITKDDVLIVMGAGDINAVAKNLTKQ